MPTLVNEISRSAGKSGSDVAPVEKSTTSMGAPVEQERRMTWQEMVDAYPDQWVVVRDAEMDGPDIVSGVLVTVKPDEDIDSYEIDHLGLGYKFRRTTEGFWNGITGSSIVISVD